MLEINNLAKIAVDRRKFSTVAKNVLKGENREMESISLAFVSAKEMQKLNNKFRKKKKATDVLSFELNTKGYLGEIVICPAMVKDKRELFKVFIHGILHLCGYEHEKSKREAETMEKREKYYFKKLFSK